MTIQPKFHWQFRDRAGATTTVDSISKVQAKLSDATPNGHGRIGRAMHLLKKDAHVSLGKAVGQFGTGDFTIAFGMKNINNHGDTSLDIIGSQTMKGHGNFFSVRLSDKRRILFHVDENSKAKHYVRVQTDPLSMVYDRTWFHVAVVRNGPTLQIYIDGVLSATAKSKTGVANIKNNTDVKLGHSRRHTPNAQYEDLRIYDRALDATEIQALIPPINRPLSHGEIELVATDGAAMILRGDVGHLSRFSQEFQKLRVGPDTAVALFNKAGFGGTSQLLYADLPDIKRSRLKDFPASVRIRSAIGNPFTGKWLIKAPNGQFLSLLNLPVPFKSNKGLNAMLITSPKRSFNELFKLQQPSKQSRTQLVHDANKANTLFRLSPKTETIPLFIEELQPLSGEFAIVNQAQNQWLEMGEKNTFQWTDQKEKRAVFARVAKMADKENQVGELAPGEVALYEHVAYHGRTWILSDTEKDLSGEYPNLSAFESLQDKTSSIRLGPKTGVTVFRDNQFRGSADDASLIEDIVDNVPSLFDSQIGNDTISSIKILRFIDPTEIFTSYTSKLSQDYRMVGDKLEEFSAYRTILRLEADAGEIEVSATDLTKIEVDGKTYEIDEQRPVTLKPNAMNRIMITSEADGIDTPGLKFRTQSMAPNEQVVIFPNQEVHRQIAELEDGALWNATDTQGNLIVDHKAHSKEEVARVQNTIKRMMGTVTYDEKDSVLSSREVTNSHKNLARSSTRAVSGSTIENHPWELKLSTGNTPPPVKARKSGAALLQTKSLTSNVGATGIEEKELDQDEFTRLLSQASSSEQITPPVNQKGFGATRAVAKRGLIRSIGRGIKKTFKKAKSVVVGAVKGVVHVLVKTVEGVIDFVVDTVKKVVEFVEAVIETVVKAVKKFIEFLQFLFNWDDILDTQKYLVQAINDGFDYTAQQIDALKGPVSNFIDDLQETVEGAMNQLVTTLGGDPSEVREGDAQLPEAVEWFLSKLLGGSQEDDAEPSPRAQTQPSGDSKLESFLFHFQEAFLESAGAILRGFEGLGETIATLISNPLKPQLAVIVVVETLRDVVIQLLEAVENLALGFLDAIAGAIEQLKKILNSEIKIPFISDLFRLIGAGKLTLMNLTGLLVAIPATVVSKLIFGETPFKNEPPLNFAAPVDAAPQASLQRTRSVVAEDAIAVIEPKASIQTIDKVALKKSIQHWGNIGLLADVLNGLIAACLDAVPEGAADKSNERSAGFGLEYVSLILGGFSWLASFPSSPDFPGGRPYNVLAHKVSKSENEQEYWERVMWGWRTAMYWLDVVVMIGKSVDAAKGRQVKLQRFKRASTVSIGATVAFSVIDAGLAIKYLTTIPKEDNRGLEIANEVVSWLPNMFAPMRLFGPQFSVALSVVDVVAAFSNYGMGHKLLADDLAEL